MDNKDKEIIALKLKLKRIQKHQSLDEDEDEEEDEDDIKFSNSPFISIENIQVADKSLTLCKSIMIDLLEHKAVKKYLNSPDMKNLRKMKSLSYLG